MQQKPTMVSSEYADRQRFRSEDGTSLASPRSHPCAADTEKRYILWSDIQCTFQGIDHLEAEWPLMRDEVGILFMTDEDGE